MEKPITIRVTNPDPDFRVSIIKDFRVIFGLGLRDAKKVVINGQPIDIYLEDLPYENLNYLMFENRRFVIEGWETPEERIRFRVMWHRAKEQKLLKELATIYGIARNVS